MSCNSNKIFESNFLPGDNIIWCPKSDEIPEEDKKKMEYQFWFPEDAKRLKAIQPTQTEQKNTGE